MIWYDVICAERIIEAPKQAEDQSCFSPIWWKKEKYLWLCYFWTLILHDRGEFGCTLRKYCVATLACEDFLDFLNVQVCGGGAKIYIVNDFVVQVKRFEASLSMIWRRLVQQRQVVPQLSIVEKNHRGSQVNSYKVFLEGHQPHRLYRHVNLCSATYFVKLLKHDPG